MTPGPIQTGELDEEHLAAYGALVAERLAALRVRIASAGGDPDEITVVGVTKTFGLDAVVAALRAGITDIGENYADELVAKAEGLAASSTLLLLKLICSVPV